MKTEIEQIHQAALERLASTYQMPGLLGFCKAMIVDKNGIRSEHEIVPTGQMAALVRKLTVVVHIGQMKKTAGHVVGPVTVELLYDHHMSGSNGHNEYFVAIAESTYRFGEETLMIHDLIRRNAFDAAKAIGANEFRKSQEQNKA